jgi:hypothetical protein
MRRFALLGGLWLVIAGVPACNFDRAEHPSACEGQGDCEDSERCVQGFCLRAENGGDSDSDAGAGDAGSDAGGQTGMLLRRSAHHRRRRHLSRRRARLRRRDLHALPRPGAAR